jgi:hypothetical protein
MQNERRYHRYVCGPNPVLRVVSWWQSRGAVKMADSRLKTAMAHERLTAVELALRCYLADQGRPPGRLDDLAPRYLSRTPTDPFSGQPLIYRPQNTNWLLYSVGPDGVDDGGRPAARGLGAKGDLLFNTP